MKRGKTKTVTIYNEKYYARERHVTAAEAQSIIDTSSVIYAVEQGEIELPSFENQRRIVCVLRFERIVPTPEAAALTVCEAH
jgi:hypothetical protein